MKTTILSRLLSLIVFFSFIVLPVYSQQKDVFEGSWQVVRHSYKETGEDLAFLGKYYLNISEGNYVIIDTTSVGLIPPSVISVNIIEGPDTTVAMDTIPTFHDERNHFSIDCKKYKKTSENTFYVDEWHGIKDFCLKYYAKGDRLFFEIKHGSDKTILMELEKVSPTAYPISLLSIMQSKVKNSHPLSGMWNRTNVYANDIFSHTLYTNSFLLIGGENEYILFDNYDSKSYIKEIDPETGEERDAEQLNYSYYGTYGKIKRVDDFYFLDGEDAKVYTSHSKPSTVLLADSDKIEEWVQTYEVPEFFKSFAQRLGLYIDIYPKFPGGMDACKQYIASHIKYPPTFSEKGAQIHMKVSFTVDKDGSIRDVARVGGSTTDQEIIAEVIRVFKSMPAWTPGYKGGKPVATKLNIPVNIRIW